MKIIEVLRLAEQQFTQRQIAASVKCAKSTVGSILRRCHDAGLTYQAASAMTDDRIDQILYPQHNGGRPTKDDPDWQRIQTRLDTRKRVNLYYLWEEYNMQNPDGLKYSQFCSRYHKWRYSVGKDVVMVQDRQPGYQLFADWAGDTLDCVLDSETGKLVTAHFFIATLGDSGFPVAEAFPDEKINSWLVAHVHAFTRLGGLPRVVVPDNCKTAIHKAQYYDPVLNRPYQDLAAYYQVAVIPARVREPRDKAPVESAVGWLETWLLEWLYGHTFTSFAELNQAIAARMDTLVTRPFQKRAGTRQSVFLSLDKPALRPLPPLPYEVAEYLMRRVPANYHLEYRGFYYSVPYQYYKQEVTMRITPSMVEVYDNHRMRIALHVRRFTGPRYLTERSHMPANHQVMRDMNQFDGNRYRSWAHAIGEHTTAVINALLDTDIEQTAYRSCMGILQFSNTYGKASLEAACRRAQELHSPCYATIASILKNRQEYASPQESSLPTAAHQNLRGASSFV
jgi:transposase